MPSISPNQSNSIDKNSYITVEDGPSNIPKADVNNTIISEEDHKKIQTINNLSVINIKKPVSIKPVSIQSSNVKNNLVISNHSKTLPEASTNEAVQEIILWIQKHQKMPKKVIKKLKQENNTKNVIKKLQHNCIGNGIIDMQIKKQQLKTPSKQNTNIPNNSDLENCNKILESDPKNITAIEFLIKIYFIGRFGAEKNYKTVEFYCNKILEIDPKNLVGHAFLSEIFYNGSDGIEKNYKTVESYCNKILEIDPENIRSIKLLLKIYSEGGHGIEKNYKTVETYCNKMLEIDPKSIWAAEFLAIIFYFGGYGIEKNFKTVETYCNKILEIDSKQSTGLYFLVKIYFYGDHEVNKNYNKVNIYGQQVITILKNSNLEIPKLKGQYVNTNFILGMVNYLGGDGEEINIEEALRYFSEVDKETNKENYDLLSEDQKIELNHCLNMIQDAKEIFF